jgi:2,4-dienoyl-CoA reductase-like NADH-dependent reductase (Old Yellow Enzyme family)
MTTLFDPLQVGDLRLPNRIVMAPLTRLRADPDHRPNDLMATYYSQRASAGLIVTEGVPVSPQGVGYRGVSGIWAKDQVEGWKHVTGAVKDAGGLIFMQLWHVGRISDPSLLDGELPVSASAIAAGGHVSRLRPERPHPVPRALEEKELAGLVETFRRGAQNALSAGFDGVEIHAANGYLLDQFLQGNSNQRSDGYGGSIENRARLLMDVTDAAISVYGAGRVGVHLAPRGDLHSMGGSDLPATFKYTATELGKRKIAFLCAREAVRPDSVGPDLKAAFGGVYIANEGFNRDTAEAALTSGWADAVAFGKTFIANPDLPARLRLGAELNAFDASTFYTGGTKGYIDYPFQKQIRQAAD